MTITIGSMFTGMGGLDMGVTMAVPDTRTAWVSESAAQPSLVLAHRFPHAPNLGDVTRIDWATVEPVDIIIGGSPCTDLSVAGKRAGMVDGTRSGLWSYQADAVAALKPRFVLWENVRGAITARALTPDGRPTTAILRVTSDLTRLGYDVRHTIVRASDVGAPHQRARVFLLASAPGCTLPTGGDECPALEPASQLLPTPRASQGASQTETVRLLPTPAVNDMGAAYTPETWDAWTERMRAAHGNGNGHGRSLAIEAQRFGPYVQAVARWETITGRRAPAPTEPCQRGGRRLNPEFASWMMGLPREWITGVPGVTRPGALAMCGNGVVPQQAAHALRVLASEQTDDCGTPSMLDMLDMLTEVAA